jgi:CDI immunity protein
LFAPVAWYISAASQTTTGIWIGNEPQFKLPVALTSESLGLAIEKALDASGKVIPHPAEWTKEIYQPMLDLAGVESWRKFAAGTASLLVTADETSITIEPCKNDGPKDGYSFLPHKNFSIPLDSTAEAIGNAVMQGITLCE